MKDLIAVAAIAAFAVACAAAEKPPAPATDNAMAAVKAKPLMVAARQLPFDPEWSKN